MRFYVQITAVNYIKFLRAARTVATLFHLNQTSNKKEKRRGSTSSSCFLADRSAYVELKLKIDRAVIRTAP